jgi:hypothetical protein
MILRLSLIAGLAAVAITAAVQDVSAVPLTNNALGNAASEGNLVGQVQYRYCHRVREVCVQMGLADRALFPLHRAPRLCLTRPDQ